MNQLHWDGHCHSQFCPHGKQDPTEEMVQQAIKKGFRRLSLTEHAPLPKGFIKNQTLFDELALTEEQLPAYLEHARHLKQKYADQIEIWVGLEIDYLVGYEDYLLNFYRQWGSQLDDSLLSVHFIPGDDELLMLDYSPKAFQKELLAKYKGIKEIHQAYWETVLASITLPFETYRPKRLGHLGLASKFCRHFPAPVFEQAYFLPIAQQIKNQQFALDFNVAGLSLDSCRQIYLPPALLHLAQEMRIPQVYGSDAHGTQGVGRHYDTYLEQNHV